MDNILRGKCSVVLNDKPVLMIFSSYSVALFCELMDCKLNEINKLLTGKSYFRSLCTFIWCGIETGCAHSGTENNISRVEVAEIFDTLSDEDVELIVSTINISLGDGDTDDSEMDSKKK